MSGPAENFDLIMLYIYYTDLTDDWSKSMKHRVGLNNNLIIIIYMYLDNLWPNI